MLTVVCVYSNIIDRQAADGEQLPMIMQNVRWPSKPGRPVAKCDHGIYVTVLWAEDDDGADTTGCLIKYGDDNTDVDDYTVEVAGNTTNFQFTHQLKQETHYQFAVAAVNKVGRGEFSDFSDYVSTETGKLLSLHFAFRHVDIFDFISA